MAETILSKYQKQAPSNREQRRKLIQTQGWAYKVYIESNGRWSVYKEFTNGILLLHDKSSNHDTTGK